jgi:hypothetical protein
VETSIRIYQTIQCNIAEDSHFQRAYCYCIMMIMMCCQWFNCPLSCFFNNEYLKIVSLLVSYGCETWSVSSREEHILKKYEGLSESLLKKCS